MIMTKQTKLRTMYWHAQVLLVVLFCACAVHAADTLNLYVSTNGSDSNNGSSGSPFQTVAKAQATIRGMQPLQQPVVVNIAPGMYRLSAPLKFGLEDSGTAQTPITYSMEPNSAPGSAVVLGGSETLTGWAKADPSKLPRKISVNGSLWVTKLPENARLPSQLFRMGVRLVPARTPVMQYAAATSQTVTLQKGQLPNDVYNLDHIRMILYESWTASFHQVASINETDLVVMLKNPFSDQWAKSAGGARFYVENMLEALDQYGEFYADPTTRDVYVVLPEDQSPDMGMIEYPVIPEIITAVGDAANGKYVEYVSFKDMYFVMTEVEYASCFANTCSGQSASFLTEAAIHLTGARFWTFDHVSVAHTGGYGVWFDEGCKNSSFVHSTVYDVGAGAVRIGVSAGGSQPNVDLQVQSISVTDNEFTDGGHVYQEGCGVLAQQVNNVEIAHNSIHHFKYTGVSVGWTWGYEDTTVYNNTVAFNDIYSIGLFTLSDMGCVYTLGNQPGTKVVNNVCHDVDSFNYGGWGYYLDQASRNITYEDNIVYHTKCAGLHQHFGLDNLIRNNVFAEVNALNCDCALRASTHPGTCTYPAHGAEGQCSSFTFDTNIVFQPSGGEIACAVIPRGLNNMTFVNNVYWNVSTDSPKAFNSSTFTDWQQHGKDLNGVLANPEFTDAQNMNFGPLAASSPALKKGFKPIDTSAVGPRAPPFGSDYEQSFVEYLCQLERSAGVQFARSHCAL